MAAKSGTAMHPANNRIKDDVHCTKPVQNGSNASHAEVHRRNVTIQYLHACGHSNAQIAKALKVHRNTVTKALAEELPSAPDMEARLARLDDKALNEIEAAMDDERKFSLPAATFYLTRRSILGEPEKSGQEININLIIEKINENRTAGFAAYGLQRAMSAGDN